MDYIYRYILQNAQKMKRKMTILQSTTEDWLVLIHMFLVDVCTVPGLNVIPSKAVSILSKKQILHI